MPCGVFGVRFRWFTVHRTVYIYMDLSCFSKQPTAMVAQSGSGDADRVPDVVCATGVTVDLLRLGLCLCRALCGGDDCSKTQPRFCDGDGADCAWSVFVECDAFAVNDMAHLQLPR